MPTANIRKGSGTSMLRNFSHAAGIMYDTDDDLVKLNGNGTVQPLGFGLQPGTVWCVDGSNGSDAYHGKSWAFPFATIQAAIDAAAARDTILILEKKQGVAPNTDPNSYVETLIIPNTKPGLALVGVSRGLTQGGMPQIRIGAGAVPMITVRALGCLIQGLGINGYGATGGGVLLDTSTSPITKDAAGTVIRGCHFKNCQGSGAAATGGGAVYWSGNGGSWQVRIEDCHFYKCRLGIGMLGTSTSIPQDVTIRNCEFSASVNTEVDADIYVRADGILGLIIDACVFACPDVPGYASSPTCARYIHLATGTAGIISNCFFACTGKSFHTDGDAVIKPATVYVVGCHQDANAIAYTA